MVLNVPKRHLAQATQGKALRWYFWRAWMPDGLICDQFDERGRLHKLADFTSAANPLKVGWLPFSMERARNLWEQGITAIPTVQKIADEKPAAELTTPDGSMILPTSVGRGTIRLDGSGVQYAIVEYHLESRHETIVLRPPGTVTKGPAYFKGNDAQIDLGKQKLTSDFELKRG